MPYLPVPETSDEPLSSVLRTLNMKEREPGSYVGSNLDQLSGRVYGGQVFAQAVVAAHATVGNEYRNREIHSITAAFLRPGRLDVPTQFDVEEVLDGRSFSTRRVHASQEGKTILSARASFQEVQPGVEHETAMPQTPDPESLPSSVSYFANMDHPLGTAMNTTNATDMRHVGGPIWVKPVPPTEDATLIWFRLRNPMPAGSSQLMHRALLAYATDQFMLEPVMRRHGMYWMSPDISLATLDHAIWWHRDVDMSDWILAELTSPSAQGGRGLSLARFFQQGRHVATMSQEGMVRTRRSTTPTA
ncbi:thioesterase family protein [Trueperella pecoris]|uniref:Thioesterase family protein n=1 Tax=Trueperella pecoris TaxID=2733571 RepID=A0A7M1R1Z1_9ACTO|nr:acyl-CoA thioesterase domain-containing protein [Trueperella pecoris]QOR48309.1 thioesterase family protein [Trueperella pecoris]